MTPEEKLGDRLRKERLRQGLRVNDFTPLDQGRISRIENGIWKHSNVVYRYAEALGLDLERTYVLRRKK